VFQTIFGWCTARCNSGHVVECWICDREVPGPVWARKHCRISPPRFLAECRKKRLNQASFVLLYFVLFAFSGLCLVFVVSVLDLSSVTYFPAYTDVNGTV